MDKKIFDVVFLKDKFSLITKRIQQNEDVISKFFIISNEQNFEFLDESIKNNPKVIFISDQTPFEEGRYFSKLIRNEVKKYFTSFEDLVLVSNDNEIPNKKILENLPGGDGERFSLYHKIYVNHYSKSKKFLELGCLVFDITTISVSINFLSQINSIKNNLKNFDDKVFGGETFIDDEEKFSDKYFCKFSKKFVPYESNNEITSEKNFLICFDNSTELNYEKFDEIFFVKTKSTFPEVLYTEDESKLKFLQIFLPNQKLYEDKNFKNNFLIRESLRILNFSQKKDKDIVWIQIDNVINKYEVSELKNPS